MYACMDVSVVSAQDSFIVQSTPTRMYVCMYVCMHVCMYACMLCMYDPYVCMTCMHVCMYDMHDCACMYFVQCIYVGMCS
jgi:hypothetical protein